MDIFPHHSCPCHCMFSNNSSFSAVLTLFQEQFSNLKWCRSHHKVCSVLETIKAFGWICWGLLSILLIITLIKLVLSDTGRTHRGAAAHPQTTQTRQANTTTVPTQPQPHTVQPVQPAVAHGAKTQPTTTNTTYYDRDDHALAAASVWSVRPA